MPDPLRIGLAGLGTVGAGVVKILQAHGDTIAARAGRPVELAAISARSRHRDRGVDLSAYAWEDDPVAWSRRGRYTAGTANGRRLRNYLDWEAVKLDLHVGDVVTVEVRNGRDSTSRRIVTGDLPTVTAEKYTVLESLELVNVTPAIQAERGIRSEQGVLIFKLAPEVARATGLQEGDVILAINRTPVRTAAQVQELLNVRPGEVIRVYLERDAQITFTDLVFR